MPGLEENDLRECARRRRLKSKRSVQQLHEISISEMEKPFTAVAKRYQ
jgi:hypothetical protein